MEETTHISPLRRWLESMLVWYILFMILYLMARFVLRTDWRFIALVNNIAPYLFFPVLIGLLIALLLRARRLSGLYFLVILVGILWIVPPLIPKQFGNTNHEGTQVEVITLNLYPFNTSLDQASAWISAYAPDILALQEMPDDMSAFDFLNTLYSQQSAQTIEHGSIVYTNFPILASEDIDLGDAVIQRLVLDIEGTEVALYNVHLSEPLNDRETDWIVLRYDESLRNVQISALIEIIHAETLPMIVLGDFNMTEWSPSYHQLTTVLEDAYRKTSWGIGATYPAGESEELNSGYPRLFRLDYLWYSDSIAVTNAVVGANIGSDHLPLRVELVIP